MFCSKCGKEIENGAKFCSGCGASVGQVDINEAESVSHETGSDIEKEPKSTNTAKNTGETLNENRNTVIRKKSFVPLIIIGAAAAIMVISLIIFVTGILVFGNPQQKYEHQLSLGKKYLNELDYEKAIAAYRAAIEIDPKNPDAYKALAELYVEMEEPEEALAVLQEGIDATEDEILEKMYEQVEEQPVQSFASDMDDVKTNNTGSSDNYESDAGTSDSDEKDTNNDSAHAGDGSYTRTGEYVIFGSYEQDGNVNNGPEPIEWEVLDEGNGKMLLISRYILDWQPYNTDKTAVTWENCTLRSWLNNDFYNIAFSTDEQSRIITADLSNPDNTYWDISGGNNTQDKLFLLSIDEIRNYYSFNSWYEDTQSGYCQSLLTEGTAYAKDNGLFTNTIDEDMYYGSANEDDTNRGLDYEGFSTDVIGKNCGYWWLRSPGYLSNPGCIVGVTGYVSWSYFSYETYYEYAGVRPAMYIEE